MIWAAVLVAALVAVPASMTVNKQYGQGTSISEIIDHGNQTEETTITKK